MGPEKATRFSQGSDITDGRTLGRRPNRRHHQQSQHRCGTTTDPRENRTALLWALSPSGMTQCQDSCCYHHYAGSFGRADSMLHGWMSGWVACVNMEALVSRCWIYYRHRRTLAREIRNKSLPEIKVRPSSSSGPSHARHAFRLDRTDARARRH